MRRWLMGVILLGLTIPLGWSSPSLAAQRRIAVLDFRNTSKHTELSWLSQAVPETLITKLAGVRSIHVVERGQLEKVIKEQKLGLMDLFDPSKAAKVGRLAGAQVIVIGGFVVFGKGLMFNLRFVDTETGIVMHAAQVRGGISDEKALFGALNRLADAAVESLEKKVVIKGGETKVVKATPVTLTPKERKRLKAPPAKSLTAYALYGKGLEAYKKHRWREAEALYARALERDPRFADAALGRAEVLVYLGRYREALGLNARALALYRDKNDEKSMATVLNNIGVIHKRQGRYAEAMRRYKESIEIGRRLGNQAGIATTLNNIGLIHGRQGRYDEAMRYFKESLEIERRLGYQAGISTALNNIGGIHDAQGRYDEAMRRYEESLSIDRRVGNQAGTATRLSNIGLIHGRQGRYDEAMRYFKESLAIERKLGNQAGIARTLNNIGVNHEKLGRYDEAMRRYKESLEIDRRLGNQAGIANTLDNIGVIHEKQGRYDEAMRYYEESLEIERRLGTQAGIATTLNNIGMIHKRQGRYAEAMRYYKESLEIDRRLGNQAGIATTLNNMGALRYKQGKYREALRLLCETLAIQRRIGVPTKDTEAWIKAVRQRVPGGGC